MTALARVSDDLLLAAQSGDRHALTQLLVALQPDIRRYARRHCHRTSVIEDVVQEALIVVYRRVGTVRSPAALAGWLVTVIARLCMLPALMLMRGVEELASLEESRELAKVPPDELRMDLVNAIESLSPSHREVLLLRDLEDLTIGEIAGRLGVTREEILVLGDMENDLEMFAKAGFAVAMGNAAEAVKRVADHPGVTVGLDAYLGL